MISLCLALSLSLTDLLATVPSLAPAQQRVGSGGHALDANLKLGSGGYNRRTVSQRSQFHRPHEQLSAEHQCPTHAHL